MIKCALVLAVMAGAAQADTAFGVHMLFNNPKIIGQYGNATVAYMRHLDDAAAVGAQVIRYPGDWIGLEPEDGQFSAEYIAQTVALLAYADSLGIEVVMLMGQTPDWALPKGVADGEVWYPPADAGRFAEALVHLAREIDHAGQRHTIIAWEIWNEPNAMPFWQGATLRDETYVLVAPEFARDYTVLLNASYDALKAYDPEITVLGGSIGAGDAEYIEVMYESGARFDALSLHPYARVNEATGLSWGPDETSDSYLDQIWAFEVGMERIRALMVAHGDADRDIWVTEFGWSSNAEWGGAGSVQLQAQYTQTAMELLAGWDYVPVAIIYRLYDDEEEMGLMGVGGAKKPVARVFRDFMESQQ